MKEILNFFYGRRNCKINFWVQEYPKRKNNVSSILLKIRDHFFKMMCLLVGWTKLVQKFGTDENMKYTNLILPKKLDEISFDETIKLLSNIFGNNIEQVLETAPHLPPIMKTIKIRRTRHAGEVRTSSWVMYSSGPLHMDKQRQDVQFKPTNSSSVLIQDVALRICRKQWMIERCVKRGSRTSMLIAWLDDFWQKKQFVSYQIQVFEF